MRYHRILLLLLILVTGCNSFQVITHLNEKADFSKFHTFKTINDLERPGNTDAYNEYIELDRAIAEKMKSRGYKEELDADLGVHYRIILNKESEVNFDRNRAAYLYTTNQPMITRYTQGVLIIEMRDRQTRKVVWQASLDLRINRKKDLEGAIENTVNYIFNEYPFQAGSNQINLPEPDKN